MASESPRHPQFPQQETEVSYNVSGDGAVSVRINNSYKPLKHVQPHGSSAGAQSSGNRAKPCKYSISSSCSSGESGYPRAARTGSGCLRRVPQLFEQSAGLWWNPRFDSPILEKECRTRYFPQTRRRFRYVLFYLAIAAIFWAVYFSVNTARCDPISYLVPTAAFLLFCLLLFLVTFTPLYGRHHTQASLLLIVTTFAFTLAPQAQQPRLPELNVDVNLSVGDPTDWRTHPWTPCISPVGTFSLCMEVLVLLYSVLHVRLYVAVLLGLLYSVVFEVLGWLYLPYRGSSSISGGGLEDLAWLVPAKALLHLCAHAMGIHLFIMSEVWSRSTFLKVGQAILHGKELEVEKALKERMIHSVMPRRVADELMKQGDEEVAAEASGNRYSTTSNCLASSASGGGSGAGASSSSSPKDHKRKKMSIPKGQIIFRPFNMKRMEHVSILFADIVGFTKMSANKSAHALVGLLNDLFGRFDRLCELTHCEKISTLGDCYYCVAGCPEPRPDHAYCCVEMGLGMIQAIEQFCLETQEMVDMRVGVHTGTVLCGILGMKRFKFDVWSNDVNLANLMEQLGVAGKVHLSEATAAFLDDRYQREDGRVNERVGSSVVAEQLKGMKTYLISGQRLDKSQCSCSQMGVASLGPASHSHTPDVTGRDSALNLSAAEDGHYTLPDPAKVLGHSPKTPNGLLSPPQEDRMTSSQTSLCEMLQDNQKKWAGTGAMDNSALIPLRSKNFRERSNTHFVAVIKEDSLMRDYFFRPPINKLSLNFLLQSLESAYRSSYQEEMESNAPVRTFASPRFSRFLDMVLSCAVFLALTLACFLRPWVHGDMPPIAAITFATGAALLEGIALVLSIRMAFYLDAVMSCTRRLLWVVSGWLPRHVMGAVLVSLPAVSVFTHFPCGPNLSAQFTMFICCAVIIALIQYSCFCQLSSWMRSVLATVAGVALVVLLYSPLCWSKSSNVTSGNSSEAGPTGKPESGFGEELRAQLGPEAVLAFFLVLLLLWFLNREFEVSYRLHYHGNVEADRHRIKIQSLRNQADWLLGNIIPMHVAEQLKVTQSYSKNHDDAGVIFASIVNFSEFYEESYEGGKECYRVLNELIGDFDELLSCKAFHHVEKIKTIGATYMAASGLKTQQCCSEDEEPSPPRQHLRALFDFALEMMRVMDDFNKDMLGFQFKLRIGFNHGPVTAGVIGTTKLLYDIWGDTVNIASRMDSTGVECRMQVSEESYCVLSEMGYRFDYRGTVNVKGKGQMRTYLYPKSDGGGPTLADPAPTGPAPTNPVPSSPCVLTPPSDPTPYSIRAAQPTSSTSAYPLPAGPAHPMPPGATSREDEEVEEGEDEANEFTRLREGGQL
ncbi:hypothetical protein GJAV_G00265070 [Gymnothorax javanicus]|nr:hypothetical protein GJAV_G00265070 [Gymnothorax javanicus]